MTLGIPRLFGEIHDKDTQFSALMKQNQELIFVGGIICLLLIGALVYFNMPNSRQGTWRYAICKVFLERYSQYPTDLKILTVAENRNSVQIGYLTTNSYGSQESSLMECLYDITPQKVTLSKVMINRKSLIFDFSEDENRIDPPSTENLKKKSTYDDVKVLYEQGLTDRANAKYTQMHIDDFNKTINAILSDKDADLTLPPRLSDDIKSLKFE